MDYFFEAGLAALHLIIQFDAQVWRIVMTSLVVSLSAVMIAAIPGISLGVVTALWRFPGRPVVRHGLNALMAVPTVVVGLLLYGLLSRRGPLGEYGLLFTPSGMILGQAVLVLPIIWNLVITAIEAADPRLSLTCRLLGANLMQQAGLFVRETRVAILAAIVMAFGRAIGEVGVAMMLGGNIAGYTRLMTTAIALETSKGEFELALALGVMLLTVALFVNGALGLLTRTRR
jgi:tungstate transport system permease protein